MMVEGLLIYLWYLWKVLVQDLQKIWKEGLTGWRYAMGECVLSPL
jgi:hypothetical protein